MRARLAKLEGLVEDLTAEVAARARGQKMAAKETDENEQKWRDRVLELEGLASQMEAFFDSGPMDADSAENACDTMKRAVKKALGKRAPIGLTQTMSALFAQNTGHERLAAMSDRELSTVLQDKVWANRSILSDDSMILESAIERLARSEAGPMKEGEDDEKLEDNPGITLDLLGLVCEEELALEDIQKWTPEQRAEADRWAATQHALASDNEVQDIPAEPVHVRELRAKSPKKTWLNEVNLSPS